MKILKMADEKIPTRKKKDDPQLRQEAEPYKKEIARIWLDCKSGINVRNW
jgi:hypothetical protein